MDMLLQILQKIFNQNNLLSLFDITYPSKAELAATIGYEFKFLRPNEIEELVISLYGNPPITAETWKILTAGLYEKLVTGFHYSDLWNILLFILSIRLFILVIKYNIFNALIIYGITIITIMVYIQAIKVTVSDYSRVFEYHVLTRNLYTENTKLFRDLNLILPRRYADKETFFFAKMYDVVLAPDWVLFFFKLVRGTLTAERFIAIDSGVMQDGVKVNTIIAKDYFIDPFSMLVARMELNKPQVRTYYWIYTTIFPLIQYICLYLWSFAKSNVTFTYIVRVLKKYVPYFFRWHWTFIFLLKTLCGAFYAIHSRMCIYESAHITERLEKIEEITYYSRYFRENPMRQQLYGADFVKECLRYTENDLIYLRLEASDLINDQRFLYLVVLTLAFIHLGLLIYGLLHAVLGQYFYIPYLTESLERHTGFRNEDSIYSGGYTSWQDHENTQVKIGKLWFGWFGRGVDKPSLLILLKRGIVNLLRWLLRKDKKKRRRNKKRRK